MPFFAVLLAILLMNFSTTGVAIGLFIYAGLKFALSYTLLQVARAQRAKRHA